MSRSRNFYSSNKGAYKLRDYSIKHKKAQSCLKISRNDGKISQHAGRVNTARVHADCVHTNSVSAVPRLLTTEEVANLLRCKPATVRSLIRRGILPSVTPLRRKLVPLSAVEAFLGMPQAQQANWKAVK